VNDVALAIYSDRLFMAAVGVYVLAMVLHAAEYATVRAARPTVAADAPVAVVAAVGSDERPARRTGSDESAVRRERREQVGSLRPCRGGTCLMHTNSRGCP